MPGLVVSDVSKFVRYAITNCEIIGKNSAIGELCAGLTDSITLWALEE